MSQRRSLIGWLSACSVMPLLAVAAANIPATATMGAPTYTVFNSAVDSVQGSEIVDLQVTPNGKFALVVGTNDRANDGSGDVRVRSINLETRQRIDPSFNIIAEYGSALGFPAGTNIVASHVAIHPSGNYAIVTVREFGPASATPGKAVFVNINSTTGALTKRPGVDPLDLGVQAESVAIAPNGQYAVVANEDLRPGSPGTLQVIDLRDDSPSVVQTITPTVPTTPDAATLEQNDPQPETVVISPDSQQAFVTLQRNNAIAVLSFGANSLQAADSTIPLPRVAGTNVRLHPDGLAIAEILGTKYLVTADNGIDNSRPNSVSMFRVQSDTSGTTLARLNTLALSTNPNDAPKMVAIGQTDNQLRAFVTFQSSNQVGAFTLNTTTGVALETRIPLNVNGQATVGAPEGIAIADAPTGTDYVVTANVATQNISVIVAAEPSATPEPSTPGLDERVYLPYIENQR